MMIPPSPPAVAEEAEATKRERVELEGSEAAVGSGAARLRGAWSALNCCGKLIGVKVGRGVSLGGVWTLTVVGGGGWPSLYRGSPRAPVLPLGSCEI